MPDQDQENGSPGLETPPDSGQTNTEPSSTTALETSPQEGSEQRSPEEGTEQIPHDETPINRVSDALKAFEAEKEKQNLPPGTPPPQAPQVPKARDFTGLEPEMVPLFKSMSNRAFAVLKPLVLEHQKVKADYEALKAQQEQQGAQGFFEQENAYQVTPEFQNAVTAVQQLGGEVEHWQNQLAAIRAGEQWTPIVLDAKGNPVLGEPRDPSPHAEATVISQLQQAHILKNNALTEVNKIQSTFAGKHQEFIGKMKSVEAEIFKGADTEVLNKAMQSKLPLFPKYLHGDWKIQTIAKLLAINEGFSMLLNQQKSANTTARIKQRTAANAGPPAGDLQTPNVTPGGTVKDISAEFARARAMGVA